MSAALADYAALVARLQSSLAALERSARGLELPPLAGREWHDLLVRKLVPQLGDQAFLIVAVTGGTNVGKSIVFNHLAGFAASEATPRAAGTKHPVCLLPEGFAAAHDLAALFPSFHLEPWTDPAQALRETGEHLLFWRTSGSVPANLLLLDTPDIDSDAVVNWQRADAVRQSADVLIAVLTQQKYNDAAVKQFFRQAAAEQKAVVVVFNLCELPDDDDVWPLWLETFTAETGVAPLFVYLAPNDRPAAKSLSLCFHERRWPVDAGHAADPVALQDVFARLRFGDIKLQTLRGSLALIADEQQGLPSYLREVAHRSGEFRTAAELLTANQLAEVDDWPAPPTHEVIRQVREWWARQRQGWSATVHGVYDTVGQTILTPFRYARDWLQGPVTPPWELYREQEWNAIVRALGKVYTKLEWLCDLGHPLLKGRLEPLLDGNTRGNVLRALEADHRQVDFAALLVDTVERELKSFRSENPQLFQWFRRLDEATAAARPALTIVLGITGVGLPLGEAATHLASQGLLQGAMHVAGDVVGGTAVATVGETAISQTASGGAGYLQARFHRLQAAFTSQRAAWLADRLQRLVLGQLAAELQSAAGVGQSAEFRAVTTVLREWQEHLARTGGRQSSR
uniref:G domain-containing protein n=1 Tax=Schlesneria paludicola TaxID=360056 RepID=A0A7C2JZQ6_9PLAN